MSLFAGCGGSSLGYRAAGYDVRLAVDWDPKAAACYRANFPGTPFWEGDVARLSGGEALRLAGVAPGGLDVLDGSPPCQGFSTAGKRRFADARNGLFREFARLLGAFRPRAFVMENVSGLRKGKMRLAFAEMTVALKGAGYRVSCRELNAWWWGVPQDRRRLVWVGVREGLGVTPSHPAPTARRPVSVAEALGLEVAAMESHPGYRDARWRGVCPTLGAGRRPALSAGLWNDMAGNRPRPLSLPSATLMAARPPMFRGRSRPAADWASAIAGDDIKSWQAKKLDVSRPSFTQIGSQRNWHPIEARPIMVAEAKILQGFPESFQVSEYRLIGNSVPPPMAEAVGRHVAALLGRAAP